MTRTYAFRLRRSFFLSLAVLWIATAPSFAAVGERKVTKLAEGVYEIEHKDFHDGNPSGNTTVIIGDREVFVVDSCYRPSFAREDIAQIRQWTDKPVGYLLNTHFHDDHNKGNQAYMDAFPALAIIAQEETKKDMDLIQPRNIEQEPKELAATINAYKQGKDTNGQALSADDKKQVLVILPGMEQLLEDLKAVVYQSPTLTFTDKLDIDIGNREVQVKHLGRGNTPGDAIVYLPKEQVLIAGDLLVYPLPYTFDGYPSEWAQTLQNMGRLDAKTIVPGHGPVLHDKTFLYLVADLFQSAVDQVRAQTRKVGPPAFHTLDEVKAGVDLTPFRQKFAGNDEGLAARYDNMAARLVKITFNEAALR